MILDLITWAFLITIAVVLIGKIDFTYIKMVIKWITGSK
jgi:hypothetical protein